MANIANVKVKAGNVLSLSGSSVEITGSTTVAGNLNVIGTISASIMTISETIVSSSVIHHSGSTQFGNEPGDSHLFQGSVNISGTTSITGALNVAGALSASSITGDGSGLVGVIKSVTIDQNLTGSTTNGVVTIALTSSITGGLTSITNLASLSSSAITASVLSASNAAFSNSVLIYGTASLASNPTAAYVRYVSEIDRVRIFPGLDVSGSSAVSGNLNVTGSVTASGFSGDGSGLTNLSLSGNAVTSITSSTTNISLDQTTGSVTLTLNPDLNLNSATLTGSLLVSGSFARTITVVTSSYVVSSRDQVVVVNFNSAADVTVTLPSATQIDGRELIIKRGNDAQLSNKILVTSSVGQTIDLAPNLEIWGPFESKTLIADSGSTNWVIV